MGVKHLTGEAPKSGNLITRRVVDASRYSWQGLVACFRHEEAFRVEVVLGILLTPLAFWLANSAVELVLLFASMFLVLIVEILNSAIEALADMHGKEYNELIGRAKDQASAAVMLSMLVFVFTWGAVLWQLFV